MSNITLVTGLWDIKRSELTAGWNRSFEDHYIPKFKELLKISNNLIIFGDNSLEELVFTVRDKENTQFIHRDLNWFKSHFFDKIQEIRLNPDWYTQSGWLKDSTQGSLEMYNPLVMSKPFLLHDAKIFDKFNSDYLFWIDAGLTNTVHPGYFTHDKVLDKLTNHITKINFIAFPYKAEKEIHGFRYPDINKFADNNNVELVGRGGFFGGPKNLIPEFNNLYYSLLNETLNQGYMGTEESIFSILLYKYPELFSYAKIESNGLINKFFEDLKNDKLLIESKSKTESKPKKIGLYVITYNSPAQFEKLCISFENYDNDFINKPKKFLLNNSLDRSTDQKYSELCQKYGFQEIKKDNLGICGGRQFIAEHSEENNFDYHFFFEDDMFFYLGEEEFCRMGFRRKIKNFYSLMMQIMAQENFDFLKWNFSEFFGDNSRQWAWYNIPQEFRETHFPLHPHKSENDYGKEPFTTYKNIKSYKGLPYAEGEVYYCNWPQVVSKQGNKKMFLETKWEHPYEQTWMSYIFQETIKGNIKPGILLATPTEHDRFDFYPAEERREN